MANLLNFKFGAFANLPTAKTAGTVYVTTDEQAMYIDLPNKDDASTIDRLRIGDIIVKDSVKTAAPPFAQGAFYYFVQENALVRWDGETWKQINTTAEISATVSNLSTKVDQEIARSVAADNKHTADITAANTAIAARVTTETFEAFKTANTEAIAAAKKEGTEAKAAAAAADSKAGNAQTAADNAMAQANKMLPKAGGTMTGAINMNGSAITNVPTPENGGDAVNKTYVDNKHSAAMDAAAEASTAAAAAQAQADKGVTDAATAKGIADSGLAKANSAYSLAEGKTTLAEVQAQNYATKTEAQGMANAVLGDENDTKDDVTVYGALAAAAAASAAAKNAQDTANNKVTMAQVEAKDYATKTEAQNMANAVLGADSDTSDKNTVYGAKKAAAEALAKATEGVNNAAAADSAAKAAQSTANTAVTNAATAKSAADAAQKDATQALADAKAADNNANTRVLKTDFEAFKTSNTSAINEAAAKGDNAQSTANAAATAASQAQATANQGVQDAAAALAKANEMLPLAGGTMTGTITMSNSGKITGLPNLTSSSTDSDAANKKYVDDAKSALNALITTAQNTANTANTTANNALPKAGGTMTGAINMGGKQITNMATPTADAHAATKKYVDDAVASGIAASDAMVYKGVIGSQSALNAITTANKGDTYKVSAAFTVGSVKYKVGDIIINSGADGAAPTWDHITSGYEDDYLQKLAADVNNATVHLTDGITNSSTGSVGGIKFQGASTSNIVMSVAAGTGSNPVHVVTASMVWGEF